MEWPSFGTASLSSVESENECEMLDLTDGTPARQTLKRESEIRFSTHETNTRIEKVTCAKVLAVSVLW
jgi:hypothetical protein